MPIDENEFIQMKEELKALKAEKESKDKELKEKDKIEEDKDKDKDLFEKATKEKQDREKINNDTKIIEKSLTFNVNLPSFVKENSDILPSEMKDIVTSAEKENYDNATQKASAIKSAIIQSFFKIQSNMEALTSGQKNLVEDYLKLTKNGKEENAHNIFENVFEPALQMIKKVKKAEELSKTSKGYSIGTKAEDDYIQKMVKYSREKHLGIKG